jgi:hypothetical protein
LVWSDSAKYARYKKDTSSAIVAFSESTVDAMAWVDTFSRAEKRPADSRGSLKPSIVSQNWTSRDLDRRSMNSRKNAIDDGSDSTPYKSMPDGDVRDSEGLGDIGA